MPIRFNFEISSSDQGIHVSILPSVLDEQSAKLFPICEVMHDLEPNTLTAGDMSLSSSLFSLPSSSPSSSVRAGPGLNAGLPAPQQIILAFYRRDPSLDTPCCDHEKAYQHARQEIAALQAALIHTSGGGFEAAYWSATKSVCRLRRAAIQKDAAAAQIRVQIAELQTKAVTEGEAYEILDGDYAQLDKDYDELHASYAQSLDRNDGLEKLVEEQARQADMDAAAVEAAQAEASSLRTENEHLRVQLRSTMAMAERLLALRK